MERIFQILAVILAGIAAFFLWKGESDWLFACIVLSACSFFLSIRFRIKGRMREREVEKVPMELIEPLPKSEIRENKDSHFSR
jgi:hypothetical protein